MDTLIDARFLQLLPDQEGAGPPPESYAEMMDQKKQTGDSPPPVSWEKNSNMGDRPDDLLADLIADLPLDSGPEEEQAMEESAPKVHLSNQTAPCSTPAQRPTCLKDGPSSNLVKALAKSGKLPESLVSPVPSRVMESQLAQELRGAALLKGRSENLEPPPADYGEARPDRAPEIAEPSFSLEPAARSGAATSDFPVRKGPRLFMAEPDLYPAMREDLRSCRNRLAALHQESGHKMFLFTGPAPGGGVSTVVFNLALVMAQDLTGSNFLLIDANLSRPSLHLAFKRPAQPGLMNILTRQLKLEDALHSSGSPNLQLLTCGDMARHVLAPFDRGEMDRLLEQVRFYYDFILIDAAPYTEGLDTGSLAPRTDGAVLIVDRDAQSGGRAEPETTRIMQEQGAEVVGTFFVTLQS